jgi:CRISPR-associated protein Cas5t
MRPLKAVHVRFEGVTASFRHPLIISGTQLSTPVPAYSSILGMISACAGRVVKPDEARVGFEFHCRSHDPELERTVRWQVDKGGRLKRHSKGQGISQRQVYWSPRLDLYVTDPGLGAAFLRPVATPRFGRSQDIAWISFVREVDLEPVTRGAIGPTLLPYPQPGLPGLIVRLPEWFENETAGVPRRPGPFGHYQAMLPTVGTLRFEIERDDLLHPSDADAENEVIYLHRWLAR